jgi:hypothetical protein
MGKILSAAGLAAAADVTRNIVDTNGVTVTAGKLFGVKNNQTTKYAIDPAGCEVLTVATVSGAGTDQTDAAAVTAPFTVVDNNDGTVGVILPTAVAGKVVEVYAALTTNALKIYPPTGGSINGGTATTGSISIEGMSVATFVGTSATNWGAIYTADT